MTTTTITSTISTICSEGDSPALETFLQDHPDYDFATAVPWTDHDGTELHSPPVFICVDYGHIACVQVLLTNNRIDANAADDNGYTAAQWAAWKGHAAILQHLIQHGAVIDQNTLDMTTEDDGHASPAVLELIRAHMDPYAVCNGDDDEILMKACREGDVARVTALLDEGYDYNKWKAADGRFQFFSPMHVAVRRGQMEIVSLFNELGVQLELDEEALGEEGADGATNDAKDAGTVVTETIVEESNADGVAEEAEIAKQEPDTTRVTSEAAITSEATES